MLITFTPRVLVLCAIFSHYLLLATAKSKIHCTHESTDQRDATLADCYTAIDMIPSGVYTPVPPKDATQPGLWLPKGVRDPKRFHSPASFWSGTCEVLVTCRFPDASKPRFDPTADFAGFLYHTIWPNARKVARRIVDHCFPTSRTGLNEGSGYFAIEGIKPIQSKTGCYVVLEGHRPRRLDPTDRGDKNREHYYQTDASGKVFRVSGWDL